VVDSSRSFEEIRQLAFQVEKKFLKSVNLFDVFTSDKLGKDKKSYAVSFILQDERKTLTDKQIDKLMKSLFSGFEQKLGATLR
ncbi:MAG: phenylalanine--tRNA ligase subunit beta, partial [Bacteroidales bacterium]|nr:phenylalanine--tRNA ligase subunit beta [Bacteroidales bacterium]